MKRILQFSAACAGALALTSSVALAEPVEVTMLGTLKPEISAQFEAAVAGYNASQDQYAVRIVPLDGNPFAKMTTLYASGNAPTMMAMGQEAAELKDRLLDLSDTDLVKAAFPGTLDLVTDGDKIYGFPVTVEAFGFIYNKSVLDQAVGGMFDPASIDSVEDLEALFKTIEDNTDAAALTLSPMDWSLGAHYTNVLFSNEAGDLAGKLDVLSQLKAGSHELVGDAVYNGWLDTFDLMKAHNQHSGSPLSPTYDDGALNLANGDAGLWFMGNWAFPTLREINPDGEFGMIPVPVNGAAGNGNSAISVGVPLYVAIDADQSTPEEQAGAIDFMNWLVLSEEGQKHYVSGMNFIPVYEGVTTSPSDGLSKMILNYVSDGRTLDWVNMYYPADAWPAMGASMQKYLAGAADRAEVAEEIESYWSSAE